MQADPQRQWFVYFNEKELGPFSEADVKKKLAAGELNKSAYLFTEGMADWALVEDVDLFKIQQSVAKVTPLEVVRDPAKEKSTAQFDLPSNEFTSTAAPMGQQKTNTGVRTSSDPTVRGTRSGKTQTHTRTLEPSSPRRKIITALLALLVVALGYLIYQDQKNNPAPGEIEQSLTQGQENKAGAPAASSVSTTGSEVNWKELEELRASTDPNIQPFRIASGNLGGEKPIIIGVLSQMIKADKVFVAAFSDNEKSLFAIPKIWFLELPVIDGYFTVGPLSNEGRGLLPGTYHIVVAANGNFLGKVAFTQGTWPSENELVETQKKIQGERALLAEKESSSLNEKLQEMMAAYNQLEVLGGLASQGPRKLRDWKTKSSSWRKILSGALEDQRSVLAGPMFYGEAQSQLYNFMSALMKHYEALDILAKEGPAFLVKVKGKGLGQLWSQLKLEKEKLTGEIQTSLKNPPGTLKVDPELVKNRIVEMSK